MSRLLALLLLSATGAVLAAAGKVTPAKIADDTSASAQTLEAIHEKIGAINAGEQKNTFHTGDTLRASTDTQVEEQGACFMDKVDAVVHEGAVWEDPAGLQHDIVACCTTGNKLSCIKDVSLPYELFGKIAETGTDVASHAAHASALLINAASKRTPKDKFSARMLRLFGLCEKTPQECTFDQLGQFEVKTEADASMMQKSATRKHRHQSEDEVEEDEEDMTAHLNDLKKILGKIENKVQNKKNAQRAVKDDEEDQMDEDSNSEGAAEVGEKTAAAAATLEGMLDQIESGASENMHFMGDMLNSDVSSFDENEKVGGCLLDKVNGIVMDDAYLEDILSLQKAVASCCAGETSMSEETKAACLKDVDPAYKLLVEIANSDGSDALGGKEWEENMGRAARAAAYMINAAEGRLKVKKLSDRGLFFIGRCSEAPEKCTMDELFTPVSQSSSQSKSKAKATKKQKA